MTDNTVISAATASATGYITVEGGQRATITATALGTGEYVSINILCGTEYEPCYDADTETLLQITPTKNPISIVSPGTYQLVKTVTVDPSSVHCNK